MAVENVQHCCDDDYRCPMWTAMYLSVPSSPSLVDGIVVSMGPRVVSLHATSKSCFEIIPITEAGQMKTPLAKDLENRLGQSAYNNEVFNAFCHFIAPQTLGILP